VRAQIGAVLLAIRKAGTSAASVEQVRCPLTRFYQWQQNVHGYRGANRAAELKFFIGRQPSKKGRKRDLQWFRQGEARTVLEACQAIKPRWVAAFLMVCFGGGLRWGEATALSAHDIDWPRERVHVARTWSEGGGRIEECKDLDAVLGIGSGASTGVHASDAGAAIEGQLRDFPREDLMVEGKGFVVEALVSPRG
jgi:integrase